MRIPNIQMPGHIRERSTGFSTLIVCKWSRGQGGRCLLAALAVVLFFYFCGEMGLFFEWMKGLWMNPEIFILVPVSIGLLIGYGFMILLFNRTEILVTDCNLEIAIRPLPVWRSKSIRKSEILQLFVKEKISRNSDERGYPTETRSYELYWIDLQNRGHSLIRGLLADEALYLEKRLEELLGIVDQPVSGAYAGHQIN